MPRITFLEDSVQLFGKPDSIILSKFMQGDIHHTVLFNNMVSMFLILEEPAIYHCFILEQVGKDKQISYLKIDDGMKLNWIPSYDSLEYDLNLDFFKTELAGCTIINRATGEPHYIKPDMPLRWSSKYENLPMIRKKSEEYQRIASQCDDASELAEYYNNSLFFQNNTFVTSEDKNILLSTLISQTLISYSDYFFDLSREDLDFIYYIIDGYYPNGILSFDNYKNAN